MKRATDLYNVDGVWRAAGDRSPLRTPAKPDKPQMPFAVFYLGCFGGLLVVFQVLEAVFGIR